MTQIAPSRTPEPKVDFGFYAAIPRLVRTGYKTLTHAEKWLYTCLKDLCGEIGTCYRTLRVLALETDFSIASLSTMIRALHEAGLIHAEKKRRSAAPTAKEVWHITIVDIWQSNGESHPTPKKRSAIEQQCSNNEQCDENVQHVNENVQNLNNNVQHVNEHSVERSSAEQQCSNFPYRRKDKGSTIIPEERQGKEEGDASAHTSNVPQPTTSPLPSLPPSSSFSCEKKERTPLEEKLIFVARTHLAPCRKEADMEEALEALSHRLDMLAQLVGEEEALRQCEIVILYLKHVERFWKDHHQLLTMVKLEKYHDEIANKARGWTPPANATRLYPESEELPTPVTDTQEMPPSSSTGVIQASLIGMSYAETQAVDDIVYQQYPGMHARYGSFPDGSYCLSLFIDENTWCDLYSRRAWYHPNAETRQLIRSAIASYEQYVHEPVGVAS